jgi:hypothetical protein
MGEVPRRCQLACYAAVSLGVLGCGGQVPSPADENSGRVVTSAGPAGDVSGTVIEAYLDVPLSGRQVTIGSAHTTTDALGHFSIPGVSSTYDLVVTDPDGSTASVFLGLTRRDPRVRHSRSPHDSAQPGRVATITGSLSGIPSWPLPVHVEVLSSLGTRVDGTGSGRTFGPLQLPWNGDPSVTAQVFALADIGSVETAAQSFAFGHQTVPLADGAVTVSLPLSIVRKAQVTATITHPPGSPPTNEGVNYVSWQRPMFNFPIAGSSAYTGTSFHALVPSSQEPGTSLCFQVLREGDSATGDFFLDQICGIAPGTPVSAQLQAPPSFTSPAPNTAVTPATRFTWTAFEGGVYDLSLGHRKEATPSAPFIVVFTAARSTAWPDLSAVHIPFPAGMEYAAAISGVGVFASIDELCGPAGYAGEFRESRHSTLAPMKVTLSR